MPNGSDNTLDMALRRPHGQRAHAARPAGAGPAASAAPPTAHAVPGFEGFLQEQYRGLLQFLRRRTATEQDAEDAAQESLARLLRYTESEPAAAWKPLLYRIATNIAHDQSRLAVTHHEDRHVPLETQEVIADAPTPEEQAAHDQQAARLTQAILALPPKCQRVYLLKRVHGLRRAEIARRCGISVKMVEKHLATALALLRQKVGSDAADAL